MNTAFTYEHTVPTLAILVAAVVSLGWLALWGFRYLPKQTQSWVIMGIRLAFFAALCWVLLLPGKRMSSTERVRPRFFVLLDTSESMTQNHDASRTDSRWQRAAAFLEEPWMKSVRAKSQLEVYGFDTELSVPITPERVGELRPEGKATYLNMALSRLFDRTRGQDVAGVLLLSDGNDTRERRNGWADTPWGAPLYVLELEPYVEMEQIPDVRVDGIETPRRAILGWNTILTATIAGQGIKDEGFDVELLRNNAFVDSFTVMLPPEGGSTEVQFTLSHDDIGSEIWTVRIPPLAREVQTNDNEMAVSVEVQDAQNRVLFLEHTPRWESRSLVRELFSNPNITPIAFFRGPGGAWIAYGDTPMQVFEVTPDQLRENKIIIIGDFDAESLDEEKCRVISEFVDKGGSLVLIGGERMWGANGIAATELSKILPMTRAPGPAKADKYAVEWTAEGRGHPAFANSKFPSELPPVLTAYVGNTPAATAFTLMEASVEGARVPLIMSRPAGQGKVLAIMTDSLWRWTMEQTAEKPYAMFWKLILEWMSPEDDADAQKYALELYTDAAVVSAGEPVTLQARLIEPPGATSRPRTILCEALSPLGRPVTLSFVSRMVPGPGGKEVSGYVAEFTPDEAGNWKTTARVEIDGAQIESSPCFFTVRAVSAETQDKPANQAILQSLARNSGGRYATAPELNDILKNLPITERQERRLEHTSLWQSFWVLSFLIALLSIEWILRKLGSMV
ncbi:MAG: glutamine amidotransferase [Kiritimatiellaeota bacterium]|nr:glutamine amidotransferase [Kiritimatiellota bacterium]